MNKFILTALAVLISSPAFADNLKEQSHDNIQDAMKRHIEKNKIGDDYVLYDAVTGKLLRMELVELHAGVMPKGDFYVSCADFKDASGNTYDIDFMVAGANEDFSVYQALVHKDKDGKRKYHLEN